MKHFNHMNHFAYFVINIKTIVILSLVAGLAACTTIERAETQASPRNSRNANVASPIAKVSRGETIKIAINSKRSPAVQRPGGGNDFYEIVEVAGTGAENFSFTISAACDCFGFRKWTIHPVAKLYSADGELVVQTQPSEVVTVKKLSGTFPSSGTYHLHVIADNSMNGKTIQELPAYVQGLPIFTIPMKIHSEGAVRIHWSDR